MRVQACFAVIRFPNEVSCFLAAYLSYEISWFWAVTRFPYEMSCFWALRDFMRLS
jgi:hypothetical protein